MKLNSNNYAFRFFATNLFAPLLVHLIVAVIHIVGPDLRSLYVALPVIMLFNAINLLFAVLYGGWLRVGFLIITAFNWLSLFAIGALSFLTSLLGWVHIVPDLVELLF